MCLVLALKDDEDVIMLGRYQHREGAIRPLHQEKDDPTGRPRVQLEETPSHRLIHRPKTTLQTALYNHLHSPESLEEVRPRRNVQ